MDFGKNLLLGAVLAAYEKRTGQKYEEVVAAGRKEMTVGYESMVAAYKEKALEALPTAGVK